ncbi:MAG: hypothetical protein K1Y36_28720 [Blastocatellia bacterium]|nr:hypothetical protein [Blastocatellia bacterium]
MQQISNFLPMHPSQENYTECYLLLAKLALAMREEADLYNALYAVEVLDYLVDHCCFCGNPSDLTVLENSMVQAIVCQDCYTKPLNVRIASKTLKDPAIKALSTYARTDLGLPNPVSQPRAHLRLVK